MTKEKIYRGFFYAAGLLILALGITLNTKTGLGVSPIISVAFCVSDIWNLNFGNITLALYTLFIVVEMLLHVSHHTGSLKALLLKDILQLPLSLVFTRFLNIFGALIPDLQTAYAGSFAGSFAGRLFFLIIAIILTGIGAAMSLNMRIIPNPGDGIVQALSDCFGKSVGFTKNCFDLLCISVTIILGLALSGHLVGIGVGTVLAAIGVGRSIAVFNHFTFDKMNALAGI
ncbi:DUF6198 family protein [Faecalimonas umbilicata]|nr:DUF6198 family protein [Faecalimonas umbilicata]